MYKSYLTFDYILNMNMNNTGFCCFRVFLHKDWMGRRDDQLSEVSGIDHCIFCHATGFIGGNQKREGALKMALKSLEYAAEHKE